MKMVYAVYADDGRILCQNNVAFPSKEHDDGISTRHEFIIDVYTLNDTRTLERILQDESTQEIRSTPRSNP